MAPVPACLLFQTSPFDLESGVWVTCDVGYLHANFSLPRPLCSGVRPNICDRQTDRRQTDRCNTKASLNASALCEWRHNNIQHIELDDDDDDVCCFSGCIRGTHFPSVSVLRTEPSVTREHRPHVQLQRARIPADRHHHVLTYYWPTDLVTRRPAADLLTYFSVVQTRHVGIRIISCSDQSRA